MLLLRHDCEIETESLEHRFDDYAPGSVERRVDDSQRFCLANHLGIENECFEALHVRVVDVFPDRRHSSLAAFW